MELFTDDGILREFTKEHNFENDYILTGKCFFSGIIPRFITLLVDKSIGTTCYLKCFIIHTHEDNASFDCMNFQSRTLDCIFRYKYNYLYYSRSGENLSKEKKLVYEIPFNILSDSYNLTYKIGQNEKLGLLEDFERWGETSVGVKSTDIKECYQIMILLERFSKFMVQDSEITFRRISLSKNDFTVAHFYCKNISDKPLYEPFVRFYKFDVLKYIPKILNNISFDLGNKITKSIYLGHIGDFDTMFSPQRFISQVMAFEYLFEKLEPEKAKDKSFYLRDELKLMFDAFPSILEKAHINSEDIATKIKKLRTDITHGYAYYYDFKNDIDIQYFILKLDDLIGKMNLKLIGFNNEEILDFQQI